MRAVRPVLLVPALAMVFASGCQIRAEKGLSSQEARGEASRLQAERDNLAAENAELRRKVDDLRSDLDKSQGQAPKVGDLLKDGDIPGVSSIGDGGVALDEDFLFAKGQSDLGEQGKKTIGLLADRLNKGDYAASKVIVEGHTDDTPVARKANVEKYGDNWGLSAARAATVVRELQKAGVAPERLRGAFRGEFAPRGTDKNRNRRVELYVR